VGSASSSSHAEDQGALGVAPGRSVVASLSELTPGSALIRHRPAKPPPAFDSHADSEERIHQLAGDKFSPTVI
jgi:hypothetical protein